MGGTITGVDAILVSLFRINHIQVIVLFSYCNPFSPSPEASIPLVEAISKILGIEVGIEELQKRMVLLKMQYREMMKQRLSTLEGPYMKERGKKSSTPYECICNHIQ